jgi:poly-gamma-glutamate capsule biosynthesis protein CapA/YwtB (metallophosphatase superfamily)
MASRRRPTPADYRRRRMVAVVAVVAAVILLVLAFKACGGSEELSLTPEQTRRLELDQEPVKLTLSFSGDLLMHSPVYGRALALGNGQSYDFTPLFQQIRPYVEKPDLAFCHMETPMTPAPPTSYPIFNTPPSLAKAVKATGWDACDTASNHALDQGEDGIAETIKALDKAGIEHTGTATSEREARTPLMLKADGVRIAYLAYTSDTNGIPVPKPYEVNLVNAERIVEDAKRARKAGADAVIVNLHWSINYTPEYVGEPSSKQRELAARLAKEKSITALVGQGPHVVQPITRTAGKPVVFSEGNLISNQGADSGLAEASQDGYIALLDLVVDGRGARVTDVRYVPTWVDHSDYEVLPVGDAIKSGEADAATLEASYDRTVSTTGRKDATPEPAKLP